MVLSEMRGDATNNGRGMAHNGGIEPNNNEGQLGVEYLNEFNLDLCPTENMRNGDEFLEYQRQRKAAYLHHQQQQQQGQIHPMSHHQLVNAPNLATVNNARNGSSDEGIPHQQPPPHQILPGQGIPGNHGPGILHSPNGPHHEEPMTIPNGNAYHQLQIVKIMSPCSPPDDQSPTHCPQMPPSPDYRNVPLPEAHTPNMDHQHGDGHSNRNIPMWMDGATQNGVIPHLRYDRIRYDPLDLSSVGSESMDDGSHWIPRNPGCLDSPQLYMADGLHHMRSHSRNPSSEGRRSPMMPNPGGITDKDLLNLAVRDLNKLLHGLDRGEIQRIKQKRRTLKNRGYAQNCRMKRVDQRKALEEENRRLRREVHRIHELCNNLRAENENLKQSFTQGMNYCKRKYEIPGGARRNFPPQPNNNNSSHVLNNNLHQNGNSGGGVNNNGPIVQQQIPSHLNSKVIEYSSEPVLPPATSQPIVSSTVKDVRPETAGGVILPHANPQDSPEPANCYWKDER